MNSSEQDQAFKKLSRLKVGALFMEMGTGKTKVALDLIASKMKKIDYILWICPFSIKNEIEQERLKWHPELSLEIVGCESIGSSDRLYLKLKEKVEKHKTFIVVDESLKIKNIYAKRTQRIITLGDHAKYKLILNGTPVSRNVLDMWAQMEFLSPKILGMSYREFKYKYCSFYTRGRMKGKVKGAYNVPHLVSKIAPYIFDAKLDITARKSYLTYPYSIDTDEYEAYKEELLFEYYDPQKDDLNFYAFATKLQRWYTKNSTLCREIEDLVNSLDGSTVIFVKFLDSIPVDADRITGDTPQKERAQILLDFNAGKIKTLYITYGCGAYGLNLQSCHNMIFAEHTWDYAQRIQAEARIYRMGQAEDVNYYDMYCPASGLERKIVECIGKKTLLLTAVKKEIEEKKGGALEWAKSI